MKWNYSILLHGARCLLQLLALWQRDVALPKQLKIKAAWADLLGQ